MEVGGVREPGIAHLVQQRDLRRMIREIGHRRQGRDPDWDRREKARNNQQEQVALAHEH
jgi:hypothetical protein